MARTGPTSMRADATSRRYRMRELTELTGLDRQTIHYYIREGLLPEGDKQGPNTALYGDHHLERIALIKKLQRERFLPLRAIRAIIDDDARAFEPEQRTLLLEVKARLGPRALGVPVAPPKRAGANTGLVPARPLLQAGGVTARELEGLVEAGLVGASERGGRALVRERDAWVIEMYGAFKRAGLTEDLGFTPKDLVLYAEAVDGLFAREQALVLERLAHLDAPAIAGIVERVLPLVAEALGRFHSARAAQFFASLEAPKSAADPSPAPAAERGPKLPRNPEPKKTRSPRC